MALSARHPVYTVNVDFYYSDGTDVHTHVARFDGWSAKCLEFVRLMRADIPARIDTALRLVDFPTIQIIVRSK